LKESYLVLLLGTNLGDRISNLTIAKSKLEEFLGSIEISSKIYQTSAWGKTVQNAFLNQIVVINYSGYCLTALDRILSIEAELGRIRNEKWGERVIDIDILFFGDRIISESRLQVPHPYLHLRNFTLQPLKEIGEQWVHPKLGKTIVELCSECPDTLAVEIFDF
jgi:2-amino-4-hydroxy-6-hydroxymethyldihydropteridine diphosphokinase